MKKNKMMRLASALLVAVLLSTCTISGTFAKYVTSGTGTDTARVAKWGVEVTNKGLLFEKTYASEAANVHLVGVNSVESSDEWNVVAPGTTHSMTAILLKGKPEVATEVSYKVSTFELKNWAVDLDNNEVRETPYFPVIFTVTIDGDAKTYGVEADCGTSVDVKCNNAEEVISKITTAINDYKKCYPVNTDLSEKTTDMLGISWSWPFSTSDSNDVKDTNLGNWAAKDLAATIKLDVTTTVTQVD